MIRRALVVISYALLGIGIIAGTIIIVTIGQGYSYDFRTNRFSLSGLLVLSSNPSGAVVSLDGRQLHRKTPYRSTLEAGSYDVALAKDGYRTWQKRIQIRATDVTDWSNILLLPNELKSASVVAGKPITALIATRDRKRFAYLTGGTDAGVWVLSGDRKQSQKVFAPAPAAEGQPGEALLGAAWSDDGSHLLVRSQIGDVVQYSVVPSGGGQVINLTKLFKFDLSGLQFSPNDWRDMYWISPEGLRRLNVENKTVTAVLAENVKIFAFAGNDRLVFVQSTPQGVILANTDRGGQNFKRLVDAVSDSPSYQLGYSNYRGTDYVSLVPQTTGTLTVYSNVFTPTIASRVVAHDVRQTVSSDDARFVGFVDRDGIGAYNLDDTLIYTSKQSGVVSLAWFDESHLLYNRAEHATFAEFDGGNATAVLDCATDSPVFGSNDKRQVLCLSPVSSDGNRSVLSADIKK